MDEKKIDNSAFGFGNEINGSIERETSKENGMVSTCLFSTVNANAWIEITYNHNDGEMRQFRY